VILVERDPLIAATWRYLIRVSPSEILALPDIAMDQTVDDVPISEDARLLIGWWLYKGGTNPHKRQSTWMRSNIRPHSYWGQVIRERIASQVESIRHWKIIEGDYLLAPTISATWFIDPPYQIAGKHYRHSAVDYPRLAEWCLKRKGQAIVCENVGAAWLPFEPWRNIKASPAKRGGKVSQEAIWTNATVQRHQEDEVSP